MAVAGLRIALVPHLMVPALRPDLYLRPKRPPHRGIYLLHRKDGAGVDPLAEALGVA